MADRVDSASRLIAAPPERLFAAWTDPSLLVRWLPPEGARGEIAELDAQPGGALRLTLHFAAGTPGKAGEARDEVQGTFVTVDPPGHLALDVAFPSGDPAMQGTMRMDWRFAPEGPSTRATVEARGVPPGISPEDHARGLASSLENLARLTES